MVDTMGWILAVLITPANVQDRDGAKRLLEQVCDLFPRLTTIFADGGYTGQLVAWVRETCGWLLSIVKRTAVGFEGPQSPAELTNSRSGPYISTMSTARSGVHLVSG